MSTSFNVTKNMTLKSDITSLTYRAREKSLQELRHHLHLHLSNEKWKRNKCGLITFHQGQEPYHNNAYCTSLSIPESHCNFWKMQNIYTEQSQKTTTQVCLTFSDSGVLEKNIMSRKYRNLDKRLALLRFPKLKLFL